MLPRLGMLRVLARHGCVPSQKCTKVPAVKYYARESRQSAPQPSDQIATANPKPPSPAWFEGRPGYSDSMHRLTELEHSIRHTLFSRHVLPSYSCPPDQAFPPGVPIDDVEGSSDAATADGSERDPVAEVIRSRGAWMDSSQMSAHFGGLPLSEEHHRTIVEICERMNSFIPLTRLADRLAPSNLTAEIEDVINAFRRPISVTERMTIERKLEKGYHDEKSPMARIDELGRAYAKGGRKSARAEVWMVPVQRPSENPEDIQVGDILINNKAIHKELTDYFSRLALIRPFIVTGTTGKYNVFALVENGGPTGRSEAIALGIARCLVAFQGDSAKEILNESGLLYRDPRRKERKKTNQPSARAKFRWVKR